MVVVSEFFQASPLKLYGDVHQGSPGSEAREYNPGGLFLTMLNILFFKKIGAFLINLGNDTKRSQPRVLSGMYFKEHDVLKCFIFTASCFEMELSCRVICAGWVVQELCRGFQVVPPASQGLGTASWISQADS